MNRSHPPVGNPRLEPARRILSQALDVWRDRDDRSRPEPSSREVPRFRGQAPHSGTTVA